MNCYSVSPTYFLFCCSVSPYIFLKNYLYRIYFFNIELADNLALAFPVCFFLFPFSKIVIFYIFSFFLFCFFQNYLCWFYFFNIELVENLVFLSFSLKHCSFPHVFFFVFVSFFVHFFFISFTQNWLFFFFR